MRRPRAALLCALWLCAASLAAASRSPRPSPAQICAAAKRDARIRLSDTQFVACYKGQVWDVLSCPPTLRFDQRTQTCTP